jgi:hypothetical protein
MFQQKPTIEYFRVQKLEHITVKDIAWLGGLLEGEGCFGSYKRLATLKLNMTDLDTVMKAAAIMGIEFVGKYPVKNPRWKPACHANLFGNPAAAWMMTLYDFLGTRRQAKIREILEKWKTNPGRGFHNARKTHCPQGHPFSEDNTINHYGKSGMYRHCRTCVRAGKRAEARQKNLATYEAQLERRRQLYHGKLGHTYTSLRERREQLGLWPTSC